MRLSYSVVDDPDEMHAASMRRVQDATSKGYYFQGGAVGELLSLFSLVLQCRFYLLASIDIGNGLNRKFEYRLNYRKTAAELHPRIFDERERNFARGLPPTLDRLRAASGKHHQRVMLAMYHYAKSLREVGVDTEMVFMRLVSAVEALSQEHRLPTRKSPLDGLNFDATFKGCALTKKQRAELQRVLGVTKKGDVRIEKTRLRFVAFVEHYSKGGLKGGNFGAKHLKITRKKLSDALDRIYRARSKYLHSGEPMYLSRPVAMPNKWDTDPSSGMYADNRVFAGQDKLPYSHWFENTVRHCF